MYHCQSVSGYLVYLTDMEAMLQIFEDQSASGFGVPIVNRKQTLFTLEKVDSILAKSRDRKRQNVVTHCDICANIIVK